MPLVTTIHDCLFALRQLRKHFAFTATSIVILALGIGASTAVFSVLYQTLLKPLPYPESRNIAFVHNLFPKHQVSVENVSGFDYAEISRRKDVFASAGIFFYNDLVLTGFGDARHVDVVNASAGLFDVFAVPPQLGRTFSLQEDQPGASRTAILSDAQWQSDFAADPNVLGRVIQLNNEPYTIIGVMPASFQFPSRATQLWIPTALPASNFSIQGGRLEKWLHMVVRLAPNATSRSANAALQSIGGQLLSSFPAFYPEPDSWHFIVRPLADEQTERIRHWLYLAFGAVFAVFLIACINVSGLLLIRATARNSEVAIRVALGASRARILRQMVTETSVLALAGCVLGVLFAFWAVHLIDIYGPLPQHIPVQTWSLLFALTLAVLSAFAAGLLPALLTTALPVDQVLKSGTTRTSTSGAAWRNAVVAAQIALAVALIFVATQLTRSFLNLTRVPAGFQQHHVWAGAIDLPTRSYAGEQGWNTQFFEPLLSALSSLPGVESASGANAIPFNPSGVWVEQLRLPDQPPTRDTPEAQVCIAFPGYFETIGIPLLRGRTFTSADRAGSQLVAVIDQELASKYFAGQDAIGKQIGSGGAGTPARIVGVVGSVHNSDLGGPRKPEVYYPELQERVQSTYLVLRMKNDADPSATVRQAIAKIDPSVTLYDVQFMDIRVSVSLSLRRFVAFLLNGLAFTGIGLAAVGLYASLAHLVELRRREIGVRVALGATSPHIIGLILARAVIVVGPGVAVGILGAAAAGTAVRTQLFGVQSTDSTTWLALLGAILLAAAISTLLPTRRATQIDPAVALRHE